MSMDMIIQKASGASSEWSISVGMKFVNTWFICGQMFVLVEMSIYIILFRHFYTDNVKKEQKGLGLPPDTIKKRKKQNVITLSGQSVSFVVETIAVTIGQLLIFFHKSSHDSQFPDGSLASSFIIPFSATLTITFFVASPELRRFYF